MKAWTIVLSSTFITASTLGFAAYFLSLCGGDKSATVALLGSSTLLIVLGLVMAVVAKARNTRPRSDLDD